MQRIATLAIHGFFAASAITEYTTKKINNASNDKQNQHSAKKHAHQHLEQQTITINNMFWLCLGLGWRRHGWLLGAQSRDWCFGWSSLPDDLPIGLHPIALGHVPAAAAAA